MFSDKILDAQQDRRKWNNNTMTNNIYHAGTLQYDRSGMLRVCILVLVGGFFYNIAGFAIVPTLLPVFLSDYGMSNQSIAIIAGSIPAVMNMVLNPVISTASDRTRSRWGRRRPFLIGSCPLIFLTLLITGWAPEIGAFLHGLLPAGSLSVSAVIVGVAVIGGTVFQLVNLFTGTVYFYLFPDVIPREVMGRFMSVVQVNSTVAASVFHFFLLKYAREHAQWVYTVVAVAYLFTMLLMCALVKEGEYPPPNVRQRHSESALKHLWGLVVMYGRECFGHPFYLALFLGVALTQVSTACRSLFNLLFALHELGMDEAQYGKVVGIGGFAALAAVIVCGAILDRVMPLLIFMWTGLLVLISNVFGYFFVTGYYSFYVIGILMVMIYAVQFVSIGLSFVKLFPPEKYGQFSSANASCSCLFLVIGNYFGGLAVDKFGYRVMFIWDFIFTLIATVILLYVYNTYRRLGGASGNYQPPL